MIKIADILGSSIVLSSYFFVATPTPRDPANIFVVIPFFFGIAVSMVGLSSNAGKKEMKIYMSLVSGAFALTFILFVTNLLGGVVMGFVAPALLASSSLVLAHFAKNKKVGTDGKKHSSPL